MFKEPKGDLKTEDVQQLQQNALMAFNYPQAGTGKSIPVSAEILYLLCRDWRKHKEVN